MPFFSFFRKYVDPFASTDWMDQFSINRRAKPTDRWSPKRGKEGLATWWGDADVAKALYKSPPIHASSEGMLEIKLLQHSTHLVRRRVHRCRTIGLCGLASTRWLGFQKSVGLQSRAPPAPFHLLPLALHGTGDSKTSRLSAGGRVVVHALFRHEEKQLITG